MKRSVIFATLLAAALFTSCDQKDPQAPAISWPSNEKFAQMELAPGAVGSISISAPAGIQSILLTLNLDAYTVVANQYISIDANRSSSKKGAVLDIIDDAKSAELMASLNVSAGPNLRGRTMVSLDLVELINKLTTDQNVENNKKFVIDIEVLDMAAKSAKATAQFHFTSAPAITWDGKTKFDPFEITQNEKDAPKFKVNAPGKIAQLKITLEDGVPEAKSFVKNTTTGGALTIDLINDSVVAEKYKGFFPAGKDVEGKTDVTLDFGFLFNITVANTWSAGMNVFTIYCKDANGKTGSIQAKFTKPEQKD